MSQAAHINIGTNLGDRQALLRDAVAGISAIREVSVIRVSSIFESEPWGFESIYPFLNIGVMITTSLEPFDLFEELRRLERSISPDPHRSSDGAYIDRMIDIDLISYGDRVVNSSDLVLPHPRMHLRPFVLYPLEEIDPYWIHPILHHTPYELLNMIHK